MKQKSIFKAVVAIAAALTFVLPGVATVANISMYEYGYIPISVVSDNHLAGGIATDESAGEMKFYTRHMGGSLPGATVYGESDDIMYVEPGSSIDDTVEEIGDGTYEHITGSLSKIIYVGGSGPGNYSTIQEGVNAASDGDTVFVFNGTYYENVVVNRRIRLIGENRKNTIIDAGVSKDEYVPAVDVTVSDVYISDFTMTNGTWGIYMKSVSNNSIVNCDCHSNSYWGIQLLNISGGHSSNHRVINCTCYNNPQGGIQLYYPCNCEIINSTFYNNYYYGIGTYFNSNNRFINCNSYDNAHWGFDLQDASNSAFINCTSYGNVEYGFQLRALFYSTGYNEVRNCISYNNSGGSESSGFYLRGSLFSNNNIIDCISYNNVYGIHFHKTSYNNITDCSLYNNSENGIYIIRSSDNNIMNCKAYNNHYGIYVYFDSSYNNVMNCKAYNNHYGIYTCRNSPNNNIINCDSYDNSEYGICVSDGSSHSTILNCDIYDNHYGVYLAASPNCNLRENSISNNAYNFGVEGEVSDFYQDIDASNTINGKSMYYLIEQNDITLDETKNFGYLGLISCKNVTVKNSDTFGVMLVNTTDSTISNVTSHSTMGGIYLYKSPDNNIMNCNACNSEYGICVSGGSSHSNISNCDIYNNHYGVYLATSPNCNLKGDTIYNNIYNFGVEGEVSDFYHDIDTSNTVNGRPMYYLIEESNRVLDGNFGFLGLIDCTNITAKNSDVSGIFLLNTTGSALSNISSHNSKNGIYLYKSPNINITNCEVYNNFQFGIWVNFGSSRSNIVNCNSYNNAYDGVYVIGSSRSSIINCNSYNNSEYGICIDYSSHYSNIINCTTYNNGYGIYLWFYLSHCDIINCISYSNAEDGIYLRDCLLSDIINCNVYNNANYGIYLYKSSGSNIRNCMLYNNANYGIYIDKGTNDNLIYHNNFVNNVENAYDQGINTWDDGSKGNYWSDYTGVDEDGDGIGDTPYDIPGGSNQDRYPLMRLWDETPPVITDVHAFPDIQTNTEPVNITCNVVDNIQVDTVKVHIDGPQGFTIEEVMNLWEEGSYYHKDVYSTIGIYDFYIWANDTSGNIAVSDTYTFAIADVDKPTSYVDPLPQWMKAVPFTVTATAFDITTVENVTLYYRYSSDKIDWTPWTSYDTDEEKPWSWEFTGSDGYYEFYSIAVDDYGNVEDSPSTADASTGLDTVTPVTTHALNPAAPDGENSWYISTVTVTLSASDALSGVEWTWYQIDSGSWNIYMEPFTVSDDGEHMVSYYSVDVAGNREDTKSVDFKIDKTPPVTTLELLGVIGKEGWFVSDVNVTLSATDAMSGVNYTKYKVDDDEWTTYVDPFVVTENGEYTLYYYSVDLAGNNESVNEVDFKIEHDTVPPVTTHEFDGIEGDNGWFVSDVTVTLSAEDDSAGVDYTMYRLDEEEWAEYEGAFPVTEDANHTLCYYSVDRVGNEEPVNEVELKIDQTAPTINLTVEKIGFRKWLLTASVSDETSGIAKVEFYLDGELLGNVTEPPYEWVCTKKGTARAIAYDNAGNEAISDPVPVSKGQSQSQSSGATPVQRSTMNPEINVWSRMSLSRLWIL